MKDQAPIAGGAEALRLRVTGLELSLRRERVMGRIRSQLLGLHHLHSRPPDLQDLWLEGLRDLGIPVLSVSLQLPCPREDHFRSVFLTWKSQEIANAPEIPKWQYPWVEKVWQTGQPVVVDRDDLARAGFLRIEILSLLEVPYPGGGSLGVNSTVADAFGPEAIRTVQIFADLVAEGMARLKDFDALFQAEQEARLNLALQWVRNEILQMQGDDDWLQVIERFHQEVHGLIQCDSSSINLVDRTRRQATYYMAFDNGRLARNQTVALPPSVAMVLDTGKPLYRRTRAEIDRYGDSSLPAGVNSVLDVPFRGGTIAVNSSRQQAFSEREIGILEQFAQVMSEAYQRLADRQELERRTRELEHETAERRRMDELIHAQRRLGLALSATRRLDEGLHLCLETALRISGMDGGGVYLVDEQTGALDLVVHQGLSPAFVVRTSHYEPDSANAHLVQCGNPLYLQHSDVPELVCFDGPEVGMSALAALPVRHENRVIACLNLAAREADKLTPLARDGLELTASQIGGAIARLRAEEALRQREEQLRQVQKLEAIGTLAGGVAHDFNNLLQAILISAELIRLRAGEQAPGAEFVTEILRAGHRGADLVAQLLAFSRQASARRESVILTPLIAETARMLQRTIPETITLHLEIAKEVAPVEADAGQMQQVLMNLSLNAIQAMPGGGDLTLGLRQVFLDEDYCRRQVGVTPGAHLCLWVRDTGMGMSVQVQERIFEPFFTTKELGKGTGLGLAMVYGIVKNHDGHITVTSQEGGGSEFRIYLPVIEAPPVREASPGTATLQSGHETVLLVEDDEAVLHAEQQCLEQLGYRVLTATDGVEGLAAYRAHQPEIDLVIADLIMPRMGGRDLCQALRQIAPEVKVVLLSGYGLEAQLDELRALGVQDIIQKPVRLQHLSRVMRQALNH